MPNPDLIKDIADFHEKFGLGYNEAPRVLGEELDEFRKKFMFEELAEYCDGSATNDMHEMFDALIDLVYVALGTSYLHGFDFAEGWRRVHSANMSKVRAEHSGQSKRGTGFDVVKPPGWTPPDLSDLL